MTTAKEVETWQIQARGAMALALLGALILLISVGARQSYGLFLTPLTEKLALGRESFSFAVALANLIWGMAAPFTGRLADRHGPFWVLLIGAVVFALGFAGLAIASNAWDLIFSGLLMGLGLGATGFTVVIGTVGRVAPPHLRDKAITITSVGSALGLFLTIPFVGRLLSHTDLATALYIMAGCICCVTLLSLPFARLAKPATRSANNGIANDGAGKGGRNGGSGMNYLRHSLTNRHYLFLMLGFLVCGFHIAFTAVHLPAFLEDATGSTAPGTTALLLIGLGNVIGTFAAGTLGARFSKVNVLSLIYFARGVLFLCFWLLPFEAHVIYVLSFLMGLLWLGTVPLTSGLVAELYGVKWLSMLFGVVFFSHQVGSFFGSWLGGVVFDLTHSYDLMWMIAAGLALASGLLHLPIEAKLQYEEQAL